MFIEISKTDLSFAQLADLVTANLIAQQQSLDSAHKSSHQQRCAYCLLLYAAGAPIFLPEHSFQHLYEQLDEFSHHQQIDYFRNFLNTAKLNARKKQDEDYSDHPGLCAVYLDGARPRSHPQFNKIVGDNAKAILARTFAQVVTAGDDFVLPTFRFN